MPNRPSTTIGFQPALLAVACLFILISCSPTADVAPPGQDRRDLPTAAVSAVPPAPPRSSSSGCWPDPSVDRDDPRAVLEFAVGELRRATDRPDVDVEADCAVARQPLCAALFLIAATDPILGVVRGDESTDLGRLVTLHEEVLEHAIVLAGRNDDNRLLAALGLLAEFDVAGAVERGDDAVAEVLVARGAPEIVAPISAAEARC